MSLTTITMSIDFLFFPIEFPNSGLIVACLGIGHLNSAACNLLSINTLQMIVTVESGGVPIGQHATI